MFTISDIDRHTVIENTRLTRRSLLLGAASATGLVLVGRHADAAEGTVITQTHLDHQAPAIPEHTLTGTPDGIAFPVNVLAGLNRITMVNDTGDSFHALTLRVPDRVTDDELAAALASPGDPEWFFESWFAGNPDQAPPGGQVSAVVTYPAGRYVILNVFTGATARFVAHGDAWGRPAPVADRAVGLVDYGFLELGSVSAGRQVWQITNHGTTWHDITVFRGPAGASADAFMDAAMAGEAFPPAGYEHVGGVGAMSPGVSIWLELDLAPGTYIGSCFLPGDDDMPHAMRGMMATFDVA